MCRYVWERKQLDSAYSKRRYIYIYHSICQHGELTRVTYCDKAIALGLPKLYAWYLSTRSKPRTDLSSDDHSPDSASDDNLSSTTFGVSSFLAPTPSANKNSFSQSHTQQQHHTTMSTLTPLEPGNSHNRHLGVVEPGDSTTRHLDLIPRSALEPRTHPTSANGHGDRVSQPQVSGYHNVNIDIPLDAAPLLSMEASHDGMLTKLVAQLESHPTDSYAFIVTHEHSSYVSSVSTRPLIGAEESTVPKLSDGHDTIPQCQHSARNTEAKSTSPRKPIPSQWISKSTGPSLATAQRAKDRSHKKGSQSGSPIEVKTLRGTRSSVDLKGPSCAEAATFLTKEALDAVEKNLTSPISHHSASKLHGSSSKPTWHSPGTPPLRSSPSQQITVKDRLSATKAGLLSAISTHSRAPSSIAVSTGANSFYTAEGSPVRSPVSTELSFCSAAETLDDNDIPQLDLYADSNIKQDERDADATPLAMLKTTTSTIGRKKSKPQLALRTSLSYMLPAGASSRAKSVKSVMGTSTTDMSAPSQTSPRQPSRIPRVIATSDSASARAATRSSALKQTQPPHTRAPKAKAHREHSLPTTPPSSSPRHVRTLNSSGTTPILAFKASRDDVDAVCATPKSLTTDITSLQTHPDSVNQYSIEDKRVAGLEASHTLRGVLAITPLAPALTDPVPNDSAIIYSRKKPGTSGTMLNRLNILSPLIVMMAHTVKLGTLHLNNRCEDAMAGGQSDPSTSKSEAMPSRGRSQEYIPNVRKQVQSEQSALSSLGSDLRATAPAFVPQLPESKRSANPVHGASLPEQSETFPTDFSSVDRNGIPWLYYMYPIQFAYDQGFRNGRTKSPRKFKPKKQRQSLSLEPHQHQPQQTTSPSTEAVSIAVPATHYTQRQSSAELMPPPPVPTDRRRDKTPHTELPQHTSSEPTSEVSPACDDTSSPFSTQLDIIAQQSSVGNTMPINSSRYSNIDLTTVRNVGLPFPQPNFRPPTYYTIPYRHNRHHYRSGGNGLYGGRGCVGIPMHATAPFPDPVAPQGRPLHSNVLNQPRGFAIGSESCGFVDIAVAAERGGGEACNTCAPDH